MKFPKASRSSRRSKPNGTTLIGNAWGIQNVFAEPFSNGTDQRIAKICRAVYRALRIRGYGRIDLRVTPEGEIVILEANPNPNLDRKDEFAQSAMKVGDELPAARATYCQTCLSLTTLVQLSATTRRLSPPSLRRGFTLQIGQCCRFSGEDWNYRFHCQFARIGLAFSLIKFGSVCRRRREQKSSRLAFRQKKGGRSSRPPFSSSQKFRVILR